MRIFFIITLLFGVSGNVFSTGQIPDYLVIEEDTIPIFANPLEQYFEQVGSRELVDFVGCASTACWRGYIAYWRLRNDSLFLEKVTSCHEDCGLENVDANLRKMFGSEQVFASWFTGNIIAPMGELVLYVHMGYASLYEEEIHFKISKGCKKKEKLISNQKLVDKVLFLEQEAEVAKEIQDTLFYLAKNFMNWDTTKTEWFYFCDNQYELTYNRKGELKRVWINWKGETFKDRFLGWWWNITEDRKCRREVKKAMKSLNLSYLELPNQRFDVSFDIIYDNKTGQLELFKPYWMRVNDSLILLE
jgi:hypothetical protein